MSNAISARSVDRLVVMTTEGILSLLQQIWLPVPSKDLKVCKKVTKQSVWLPLGLL